MLDGAIDVAGSILQTAFGWLGIAPTDEDIEYLKSKPKRKVRRKKVRGVRLGREPVVQMAEPEPGTVRGRLKDETMSVKKAKREHGELLRQAKAAGAAPVDETEEDGDADEKKSEVEDAPTRRKRIESKAPGVAKKGKKEVAPRVWLPGAKPLSRAQRHLLFVNVGDAGIKRAASALASGSALPKWALPFAGHLTQSKGRLHFDAKPFLLRDEIKRKVRECYYDPKLPSTQKPIAEYLVRRYANVSQRLAIAALKNLETYQLNFGRRLPPKGGFARTTYKQPGGIIAIDTFYPSQALHGWRGKYSVLCCVDAWSRFSRAYPCANKGAALIRVALDEFLKEFASYGHLPRRIMSDKGSELHVARGLMERYRQARDGPQHGGKPMVLRSPTGTPILLVEAMNAQYQRRMQTFRTSGITDDPAAILRDISEQLNNQPRPGRGNLSPVQLLALSARQREELNARFESRQRAPVALAGLKPIPVGAPVRVLEMTRKEQVVPGKIKGFAPKWSVEIFTVLRRTALRGSDHFRYFLNKTGPIAGQNSYYRHELLALPGPEPDREIVRRSVALDPASYRLIEAGPGRRRPGASDDAEWLPGMD